jgi:hypothetical protein
MSILVPPRERTWGGSPTYFLAKLVEKTVFRKIVSRKQPPTITKKSDILNSVIIRLLYEELVKYSFCVTRFIIQRQWVLKKSKYNINLGDRFCRGVFDWTWLFILLENAANSPHFLCGNNGLQKFWWN